MMAVKFNFNIGVLGHVDSGKTTLARCLSTTASTAAFDKNPQSQARGITLDLGFSCFDVPAPAGLQSSATQVQITLVDCPGHASLIRTIIAGAQIIDAMMLVIDVTKGVQTQTAECLIIGEILCDHMIVVLNKVDLLPKDKANNMIEKMTKRLLLTLQSTKFANVKIIPVAAKPGGGVECTVASEPVGITELIAALRNMVYVPKRQTSGPMVFAVDHCFGIRGQGTVMTGTVLQGVIAINDNVEIPSLSITKKVKTLQMFHKPVDKAVQGDRLGVCVTQFDPKLLERGLACTPGLVKSAYGILVRVEKIPYYKLPIETKAKFHISVGSETVMGKAIFFGTTDSDILLDTFAVEKEYQYQETLIDLKKCDSETTYIPSHQFAVLQFEKCVPVLPKSFIIGSKLDMDVHTSMCRLAFKGITLNIYTSKDYIETCLPSIKVFKNKSKEGIVERLQNETEVIVKNLFKKDTNLQLFVGLKVLLSSGEVGEIEGHFGSSGKVKVRVPNGLTEATRLRLQAAAAGKKKGGKTAAVNEAMKDLVMEDKQSLVIKIRLDFKKYVFSKDKKILQ